MKMAKIKDRNSDNDDVNEDDKRWYVANREKKTPKKQNKNEQNYQPTKTNRRKQYTKFLLTYEQDRHMKQKINLFVKIIVTIIKERSSKKCDKHNADDDGNDDDVNGW
jgi:hypothetical protein